MRPGKFLVVLIAFILLVVVSCTSAPTDRPEQTFTTDYWPTQAWRTSTPEEQGFDSAKLAEELQALKEKRIAIDSLLIIRNGSVVLDAYFSPYDGSFPHKLASVTKSLTTTLVGIAIDQGKIKLDQPMLSFFPDRSIANMDEKKEGITVRHLVSNVNGFEAGCLSNDESTLIAMRANPDWVQAALDRKMTREPGTGFCYDSSGMHILSAIIQEAVGMTALDFAQKYLFEPLGIQQLFWRPDPQGYTRGWGDLYMKPLDAAKIGYLWLSKGAWEGRQIVSTSWVEDAVKPYNNGGMDDYGYGWWISDDSYYAMGRGGQAIKVYPAVNMVIVTTGSGFDYDQVSPLLRAAFADPDKPLPANPANVTKLNTVLATLVQPEEALPVGVTPNIPNEIFGKTYVFDSNPVNITTLRLDSNDSVQANVSMNLEGVDVYWPIGLDGKFRASSSGHALRGYWIDLQTLVVEVYEDGMITLQLHFEDDFMELSFPDQGQKLVGQAGTP